MSEFLMRVVDKTNDDPSLDALCSKRGDIIAVQEDGWAWSDLERSNPDWQIVSIPGAAVADFSDLLTPHYGPPPDPPPNAPKDAPPPPAPLLARRRYAINVDLLMPAPIGGGGVKVKPEPATLSSLGEVTRVGRKVLAADVLQGIVQSDGETVLPIIDPISTDADTIIAAKFDKAADQVAGIGVAVAPAKIG